MKKFTEWLNENFNIITESSGTPYEGVVQECPEMIEYLNNEIGEFVKETEINVNKNFNGLFLKNTGSSSKLNMCVVNGSQAYLKLVDLEKQNDFITKSGTDFTFTYEINGKNKKYQIHTSNKIKDTEENKTENVAKYFVFKNDIQEAIQATLLEMKAHKTPISVKTKPYKEQSDLYNWFLTSDPIKKTGICYYLNFKVPKSDIELWRTEFKNFLDKGNGAWRKCFEGIWKSNLINTIGEAFVNPITNWNEVEFLHTFKKSKLCPEDDIKKYLTGVRCNQQKDLVDKSDIIMCVKKSAYEYVKIIPSINNLNEHNNLLNELINDKELIGISLKQNNGTANLSAINFKISTTAIGDNIKDEYKSLIKYYGPNDKRNTLGKMTFPKTDASTILVKIALNNPNDLHLSDKEIILNFRPSSDKKSYKIEFSSKGNAQFGKAGEKLKNFNTLKDTNGEPLNLLSIDSTKLYKSNLIKYDYDIVKASQATAKYIFNYLNDDPLKIVYLFGEAASYPIMIEQDDNKTYKLTGCPYFKIY